MHRNARRGFPFAPLCREGRGERGSVRARVRRGQARPGAVCAVCRGSQARPARADPHTPPEGLRAQGTGVPGQGQHRGTAKPQGPLKGRRRPPHLASLCASGATNARRDRRSYRRGSSESLFWGRPLSLGDSQTRPPAGFAPLTRLSGSRPGPPPLRWQRRTAPAAPT